MRYHKQIKVRVGEVDVVFSSENGDDWYVTPNAEVYDSQRGQDGERGSDAWRGESLPEGHRHHEIELLPPIRILVGNLAPRPLDGLRRVRKTESGEKVSVLDVWLEHGGQFTFLDPEELKVWLKNQFAILQDERWWTADYEGLPRLPQEY